MENDNLNLSPLEERLAVMQQVMAFLMAHLADQGLINIKATRKDIEQIAELSGFGRKAMADIDRLFGMAELTLQIFDGRHE